VSVAGCGNSVDSDEAAAAAYLGLDVAIEKSLQLGFDGFNAASSANIDEQSTTGDEMGTLAVNGQVDQGASANKGMRLTLTMVEYQDIPEADETLLVVYDTDPAAPPALTLSLRDIPDGTITGTLVGDFLMEGDIGGVVTLNLAIAGEIEPDPADTARVRRVPGSIRVTGTATSDYGTFDVDVTI
jgi:hypothetical protein